MNRIEEDLWYIQDTGLEVYLSFSLCLNQFEYIVEGNFKVNDDDDGDSLYCM